MLETRRLLATYVVRDTSDSADDPDSLRYVLNEVNSDAAPDTVDFAIAGNGPFTISPGSPLPEIINSVVIDGTSQASYAGIPLIHIDGSNLSSSAVLSIKAGASTVEGLAITGAPGVGILLTGAGGDLVQACYIGTADGYNPTGNATGIEVVGAIATTIGGSAQGQGNLISGNTQDGIDLENTPGQPDNSGVLIEGNIIGLNAAGTATLSNGGNGIFQDGSDSTTVGGNTPLARNTISGNNSDGIDLGTGNNSIIEGNFIGTDVTGTKALGNSTGILFSNASYATIGGTVAGSGNVISGNTHAGIDSFVIGSEAEVIEGNLIGVDVTGVNSLPNLGNGVRIAGPLDCTIGGTVAGAANVISANTGDGIALTVGPADGLVVEGNYIGTDLDGDNLGNFGDGVEVWSNNITVGGATSAAGNVIAFNQRDGIGLVFGSDHDSFLSNSIFDNDSLGISFGNNDSPTPNHLDEQGFTLPQPNDYQNYPILSAATVNGDSTEIVGTINAGADTSYLVQFFASPAADPTGYGQGKLYLGSTSVTTDATFNAGFDTIVPEAVPAGWVVTATATDPLGNTSEFSPIMTAKLIGHVAVTISSSPSPDVYAGQSLTYTVTVTDDGPDEATNVTLVDTLPADIGPTVTAVASVTGVTPTISDGVVTADLGELSDLGTATVTITVQPTAAAVPSITDMAVVESGDYDPDPGYNTASLTTNVDPSADLALTLVGDNESYAGGTVTYTLTATNNGPSPADDVVVTDTLPIAITSNVTAVASIAGVTPIINGGVVTADLGPLAAGASAATVTITVIPDGAAVPQITDSATIASDLTYDPDLSNNTPQPVTTAIGAASDLQVVVSANPDPVLVGNDVTYTAVVTNNGRSDDTGVVMTDTLPTGVTLISATGGVTPNASGILSFTIGNLASGDSEAFAIVVATSVTTPSPATLQASVWGSVNDPVSANNSASCAVPILPASDLEITMSALPSQMVYAGENLTYTIIASNTGLSTDPAVTVTDTLPSDLTFVSATPGATPTGGVLKLAVGSLAPGRSSTLSVVVTPTAAAAIAGFVTNTAVVTGEYNTNTSNSASATTTVDPQAAIDLKIAASVASAEVGQPLTYTITAANDGPSDATNVNLVDTLPGDIASSVTASTSVSGVSASVVSGTVNADFGDIAAGAAAVLTITVTPTLAAVTASALVDSVSIASDQHDTDPTTTLLKVPVTPVSNLSLGMSGSTNAVYVGNPLTYTLSATNSGPSTDTDVVVTDTLPPYVEFEAASGRSTVANGVVTLDVGTLRPEQTATLNIIVSPTALASSTITNSAVISGAYDDTDADSATVSTTVNPVTGFAIQVATSPTPAHAGQSLTYTVTTTNNGPSNATGVIVTDALPLDITASVTATTSIKGVNASIADGQVTADFGDLSAGSSVTMTITVTPTAEAVTDSPLPDSATVTHNEYDQNTGSYSATITESTQILPAADLTITQFTAGPNLVQWDDTLTYTAVVTNNGPSPATAVVVTSPVLANEQFVAGAWTEPGAAGGTLSDVYSTLVGNIGDLAVGASATITYSVIPEEAAMGTLTTSMTAYANQFPTASNPARVSLMTPVVDRPGVLQFSASSYDVPENAGSATITVVRTSGSRSQVSVDFTTVSMTATAGLDYTPTTGTIVFPAGVASETIQVPVLADPYDNHNELVGLALSNPAGGAVTGPAVNATLTIVDIDPNTSSPTINAITWTGSASAIASLTLSFTEPLAISTADNSANFRLTSVSRRGSFSSIAGGQVGVASVTYNPANWTVTLVPAQPLQSNFFYGLLINGGAGGITDMAGNPLAGEGAGHPGTSFTALFAQGTNLKYTDAGQNQITITDKGGGYLEDLLTSSGLGQELIVVGAVRNKTTLDGSVVKGKHGSGTAYLGYTIYGLGAFGAVRVRMASPPFRITKSPFSPGVSAARPAVVAARSNGVVTSVRAARPKSTMSHARITVNHPAHVGRPAFNRRASKT